MDDNCHIQVDFCIHIQKEGGLKMTIKQRKRNQILSFMATIPIVSTVQVEYFFKEYGSPKKRASEMLCQMQEENLVEGKNREIGKPKIWRLTKHSRDLMGITRRPTPLTYRNIDHILSIGNVYLEVLDSGTLRSFQYEIREKNKTGNFKVYCPDAFVQTDTASFFLEVQRSPLSRSNWREKWKVAKAFFKENPSTPIITISDQRKEIVSFGAEGLPLSVVKTIKDII